MPISGGFVIFAPYMLYRPFIRPLIRKSNKEKARKYVFGSLHFLASFGLGRQIIRWLYSRDYPSLRRNVFGLDMSNPVGIAAGFDPTARMCDMLQDAGFAYVQTGPFYDKDQIIKAISALKNRRRLKIVAANLGTRGPALTKEGNVDFYETAFSLLYDFVDMFVVQMDDIDVNLDPLLNKRAGMDTYKPVLVQLTAHAERDSENEILHYALLSGVDGLIVGSGDFEKTLEMVKGVLSKMEGRLPVVASGGIFTPEQAGRLLDEGASMIELYDGLIEEGPSLTRRTLNYLAK